MRSPTNPLGRSPSLAGFGFGGREDNTANHNSAYDAMEMTNMSPKPVPATDSAAPADDVGSKEWNGDPLHEDPYAQVETERRMKERNEMLRKKLATLQAVLAQKDQEIEIFAQKYRSRAQERVSKLDAPLPPERTARTDGHYEVPVPVDPDVAKQLKSNKRLRRKGSVVGNVIIKGIKNASPELKEELFNTPRLTHREIEKLKKAMKSKLHGNGMIGKSDFLRVVTKVAKAKTSHISDPVGYTNIMFKLLDSRKLGFIRMKDWKFMLAVFCDGSDGIRLRELFLSFDTDGDETLSLSELSNLVSMLSALRPTSYSEMMTDEQVTEMLFVELDEDNNGSLSAEEFVYKTQEKEELKEIFLGMVDGFHTDATRRRKSMVDLVADLEQPEQAHMAFGVNKFNKDIIGRDSNAGGAVEDSVDGGITVDTSLQSKDSDDDDENTVFGFQ